jgi:cell division septation protein DedD
VTTQLINYIKYELQTRKTMDLPGLGMLSLQRLPAVFDHDKSTIRPPQYKLKFNSNETTNRPLPQSIQNDLLHLSNIITEDLSKYGRSKIKNLGSFSQDGGNINFISDPAFESSYSIGLKPQENVKEVSKIYNGENGTAIPTETLITKKQAYNDDWLQSLMKYLLYGLLAALLIYALFNIELPSSKPSPIKQSNYPLDTVAKDSSGLDTIGQAALEQAKIDSAIFAQNMAIKDSIEAAKKIEDNNKIKETQPIAQSESKVQKFTRKPTPPTSKNATAGYRKNESEKIDTNGLNKFNKGELGHVEGKPCVVVTGAFAKSTNTVRMIRQLQAKGYKVYTEEIGDLTRVGILYQCTATNDSLVEKVKNQVNKDAWILKQE